MSTLRQFCFYNSSAATSAEQRLLTASASISYSVTLIEARVLIKAVFGNQIGVETNQCTWP